MADSGPTELDQLHRENARLIALLETHGIDWHSAGASPSPQPLALDEITGSAPRTAQEKVALFLRLFRGRNDVYALRWQSSSGRSGFAPACANE